MTLTDTLRVKWQNNTYNIIITDTSTFQIFNWEIKIVGLKCIFLSIGWL